MHLLTGLQYRRNNIKGTYYVGTYLIIFSFEYLKAYIVMVF